MEMTVMVVIWHVIIANATLLDSRMPNMHTPENKMRMNTVSSFSENGRLTSPAKYPPALPAETIA